MAYVFIFHIALLLLMWVMYWVRNEHKFWKSFTSMYDCSDDNRIWEHPSIQTIADKALYLPRHDFGDPKGLIDFKKYENWLRCMTVTRAAYLIHSLGYEFDPFYVHWHQGETLLMTNLFSLALKPEFLVIRPRNIWCNFQGGPPGREGKHFKSSLLNYIVDRVYRHIIHNGIEVTDAKIIEALNYVQPLLLEAPCGA